MARWRIAGINFDHFHMGDNLRMAFEHADAEIVGVCDLRPERMQDAIRSFQISADRVFTDYRLCLERARPDIVLLCPAAGGHAEWTQNVAPFGVHVLIEKPFAASLKHADAMVEAMRGSGKLLAVNWPLAWYPCHRTAKRLVDEGTIGELREVHFYDGNRGPLWHTTDKAARTVEAVNQEKPSSWFYRRASGGGSLLDYLGYGTTLGTWFMDGRKPSEVTCTVDVPEGLEVDEHSVTVARYETGLSKFETRWGTFSDPWTHQPQPKCGFVLVGREGTISSYDYENTIRVQTRECPQGRDQPVDEIEPPFQNPIQYFLHCLEQGEPIAGPLSVEVSRIGQQIVDTAFQSVAQKRTLPLAE
jgi:glucose-fructose oxidoreductase